MVRVFISWSGDQSKSLAKALRDWLPQVIQEVDPWVSDDDIEKGERWRSVLTKELDGTSQGIICVTRDNSAAPWLNYEAGALAKGAVEASVRTALFDIKPTDFSGPLAEFQATIVSAKEDMYKLVQSINTKCTRPLQDNVLERVFDRAWPDLEDELGEIRKQDKRPSHRPDRSQADVLREVLQRVRTIEKSTTLSETASAFEPDDPFPVGTTVTLPDGSTGEVLAIGRKYLVESGTQFQIYSRPTTSLRPWNPFGEEKTPLRSERADIPHDFSATSASEHGFKSIRKAKPQTLSDDPPF